jgi:hypothetical protein
MLSAVAAGAISTAALAGATVDPQQPMGAPLQGLTAEQLERFFAGMEAYDTPLQVGASGKKGGFDPLGYLGGSLLQAQAISDDCAEQIPDEATITANRVTNGAMGYGLVEAIPDDDIRAVVDAQPAAQQGMVHEVIALEDPPGSDLHVGRFGWKAQLATVLSFSGDASLMEMGLTNRLVGEENDPNGINPPELADCDTVPDPEDVPDGQGFDFIDRVTDFQRFLSGPPQTPKSGMSGEAIFETIGCAVCHHPSYTTADDPALEDALRNVSIRPYTDFALHNMGLGADFIADGDAGQQDMKTPPLWGVRWRDPIWHDGRFGAGTFESRITDAINEHGEFQSQGADSAAAYAALPQEDKDAVIAFLNSLGQREFDHSGNNIVDLADFFDFAACMEIDVPITPDDPCAISDIDQNQIVDMNDFASFMIVYEGYRGDCDGNGVLDLIDILNGDATDANQDGIPDSCEPTCDGDTNGSNGVDVDDLLAVLAQWGPCPGGVAPCSADLNIDGKVDVDDLLFVLAAWGPCP